MGFFKRKLNDTILRWMTPVPDGHGGYYFTNASEMIGYWDDKQELFTDREGQQKLSKAIAYVNEDISVGDYLMKGTIAGDLDSSGATPEQSNLACKVVKIKEVIDAKNRVTVRKIWLI